MLLAVALAAMCSAGCYKRVVRAEGAGPGQYEVYEPNLKLEEEKVETRRSAAEKEQKKKFLGLF